MCGVQIDADNKVTVKRERKSSNHVGLVAELGFSVLLQLGLLLKRMVFPCRGDVDM